eukprot:jgi/Botrbrau1/2556/Bobra.0079s0043.2
MSSGKRFCVPHGSLDHDLGSKRLILQGLDFSMVHVDLAEKPGWYRKVNQNGLVPTITHGGRVIKESIDICRWLERELGGKPLLPKNPNFEAIMEKVIKQATPDIVSAGLEFLAGSTTRLWGIGTGQTREQRKVFLQRLESLEYALNVSGGPFLAGPEVSLADVVVWPFMSRFKLAAQELCVLDISEECGGSLRAWLNRMEQRASCRECDPDPKLLAKAFRRKRSLDFFDYTSYGVASVHPWLSEGVHLVDLG